MIYKIHRREQPFVQIDKDLLKDSRLSWKAKGLICYLLSCPNDWRPMVGQLQGISTDGKDAVRSAFKELQKYGYAKLSVIRSEATGSIEGTRWDIYEEPIEGKPLDVENPNVGKPAPTNKVLDTNKEKNTNNASAKASYSLSEIPENLNTEAFKEAWESWIKDRKIRKKPMTVLAQKIQLKKLSVIGAERAMAAIENSILKGYQAVFEEQSISNGGKASQKSPQAQQTTSLETMPTLKAKIGYIAGKLSNGGDSTHLPHVPKYKAVILEALKEQSEASLRHEFRCVSPERVDWIFPVKGLE